MPDDKKPEGVYVLMTPERIEALEDVLACAEDPNSFWASGGAGISDKFATVATMLSEARGEVKDAG